MGGGEISFHRLKFHTKSPTFKYCWKMLWWRNGNVFTMRLPSPERKFDW